MNQKLIAILLVVTCLLSLCGCDLSPSAEGEPLALSIVTGIHSNARKLPLSAQSIYDQLYHAAYTHGTVTMVSCEGQPRVFFQAQIPESQVSGLSEKKKQSIARNYANQMQQILITAAPAQEPQVDTLQAIRLAAQALRDQQGDKVLLVLDTGLSTTSYLDFTGDLLQAEPEQIVARLEDACAIPDCSDTRVIWSFLGQTAEPQEPLNEKQKQNLQDIWRAVLKAGGAASVEFTSDFAASEGYEGLPVVSLVSVEEAAIHVEPQIETLVLDGTSVQFLGDRAEFVDTDAAIAALEPLARQLMAFPEATVYVVGTTASGSDGCVPLSEARAQAVADLLISLGVSKTQLIPLGLGDEDPWHLPDLDQHGRYIEELAAQNRKVMIFDVNSPEAQLLRKG